MDRDAPRYPTKMARNDIVEAVIAQIKGEAPILARQVRDIANGHPDRCPEIVQHYVDGSPTIKTVVWRTI